MGIQRLLQDLLPYAEGVTFGAAPKGTLECNTIKNLVVDGPSLVYFVYHKLLSYQKSAALPPTYAEINQGVRHILADIQSHGVCIRQIFFDGGLPKSKREIRLSRMEKVRQQIEIFRHVRPGFLPTGPSSTKVTDFEKVLWEHSAMPTSSFTLSAPPFMVASAVENLRTSNSAWKDMVQVVAGEADLYCALAARGAAETIAILTNDTDLAVHDLGPNGRVALLHSLEKAPQKLSAHALPALVALSINPISVASRLNVSSLLAFGFERSLDSSASTAVIRERAADKSRLGRLRTEYSSFFEEYLPSSEAFANDCLQLNDIDARTAELLVDLEGTPHVYLTPVLEDPQRDSSWSYGAGIRQLAYSMLVSLTLCKREQDKDCTTVITEYARRGQRIAPTTVPSLKRSDIVLQAAALEELLIIYLQRSTSLAAWYSLAVHIVHQEQVNLEKARPSVDQILRLFGLLQTRSLALKQSASITWDDIHILANIHAVLYSLRMLYQIIGHILKRPLRPREPAIVPKSGLNSHHDEGLAKNTMRLHKLLSRMPSIAELFLDVPHLRTEIGKTNIETRNSMILHLQGALGHRVKSKPEKVILDEQGSQNANIEDQNGEWSSVKPKGRRKGERHTVEVIEPSHSTNMFRLLLEDNW
ncbi:hypothetical protein H2200_008840 [Cladophialophora chaetospira]|uniref:Asteroid domain-containing protein n=1 Tax=Cladophialophora chaetospira TaxID=386627 RepID=A0AA38X586_9EURO|nr:hypothetical protein H2200_008840 [Cladophialophora chaetospira]